MRGTLAVNRHGRLVLDLWWGPSTMPNEPPPVFLRELSERVEITSDGHAFPYFWVPGFDSVWPPVGVLDAQPVPAHLGTPVGCSLHHVEVAGIEPFVRGRHPHLRRILSFPAYLSAIVPWQKGWYGFRGRPSRPVQARCGPGTLQKRPTRPCAEGRQSQ